jgi:hypothetical protein
MEYQIMPTIYAKTDSSENWVHQNLILYHNFLMAKTEIYLIFKHTQKL